VKGSFEPHPPFTTQFCQSFSKQNKTGEPSFEKVEAL